MNQDPPAQSGEQGLFCSEPVAEALLRSIPAAVIVHGPNAEVLAANPLAEEMLGVSLDAMRNVSATADEWRFFNRDGSPMDPEEFPVNLVLYWKKPLREYMIGYRRPGDTDLVWGLVNADPVFGPDGEITNVVVAFMAVTEQKRAEDELKESEARFRLIAETIRDAFWMSSSEDDRILYVSPAYEHVWGRTRASLYADGRSFLLAVHPEDRHRVEEVLSRSRGKARTIEYRIVHPTGEVRWIRDRAFPFLDGNGEVAGMVGVAGDVTEIAEARRESETKTEMLQGLFDNLPALVFVKDGRGRFVMVNRRFEEVHGRKQEDVVGRSQFEIFPRRVAEMFERDDMEVLTTGLPLSVEENVVIAGELHTFYTVKFPLSGSLGGPNGLCAVSLDVTERRKAEDALLAAKERAEAGERVKSRFLSTVRHELNTPLNGILGMADLLSGTDLAPEQKGFLNTLLESAEGLRALIGRVISFTEMEKEEGRAEKEPFSLHALLESLSGTMSVMAARKRIGFNVEVDPEVPGILMGDGPRLKELLHQLMSNAVKFTLQGGVSVRVRCVGFPEPPDLDEKADCSNLEFVIKDSGVGIAEEDRERIFEPFTQAEDSLSRRFGGSGLGLSIARGLAKAMGGEIRVRSRPGQGSEFIFTAPFGISRTLYK